MKYVITGGAGNISRPLILGLLQAGHQVTVIGRNAGHLKELADAGANTAIGSVTDLSFLTDTFRGADAVYTMIPPIWEVDHWKEYIGSVGQTYTEAIRKAGVRYVVNLSSLGAHLPDGVGPVSGLYRAEQALNTLEGVNIVHLRPPYFYNNLLANVGMVKHLGIIGSNFAVEAGKFPLVAPSDIAEVALELLLHLSFSGHTVKYLASDIVSTSEVAAALGKAIGKPDLPWVLFTDEQAAEGMKQAGLHPEIVKNYVEMGAALHRGAMQEDFLRNPPATTGKVKLADFAQTFANVYNA